MVTPFPQLMYSLPRSEEIYDQHLSFVSKIELIKPEQVHLGTLGVVSRSCNVNRGP